MQVAHQQKAFGREQEVSPFHALQQQVPWYAEGHPVIGNIGVQHPSFTVTSGVSQPAISYTANAVMAQKG